MKCKKCGTEINPKDEFCHNCGAQIIRKKKNQKDSSEVEEYKLNDKEIEKLSQSFASKDEKYIASLGNGYIMSYLTKRSMSKGFAFITDKRVYFKGSCLSGTGKKLVKTNEERTVDVKNITGSGFIYQRYWGILIALFLSILVSLAGAIWGVWLSHYMSELQNHDYFSNYSNGALRDDLSGVIRSDAEQKKWEELLDILDELSWEEGGRNSESRYGYSVRWKASYNGETICEIYYCNADAYYYIGLSDDDSNLCYDDYNSYSVDTINSIVESTKELIPRKLESWHNYKIEETHRNIVTLLIDILPIGLGISLVIACCIGIKNYLLKRKTLFRIEYAGGCIAFDVSFYAKAEIDDFQKQLRRVKDFVEETATIKTVAVETPTQAPVPNSVPDDLRKYADLLKDGLISQEEYDAMKKKILGL